MSYRFLNSPENERWMSLKGPNDWIYACAITKDGTCAAIGGTEGIVFIHEPILHRGKGKTIAIRSEIRALSFSTDGKHLIVGHESGLDVYDRNWKCVFKNTTRYTVRNLSSSPCGRYIAAIDMYRIRILDLKKREFIWEKETGDFLRGLIYHRSGNIFVAGDEKTILKCDTKRRIRFHQHSPTSWLDRLHRWLQSPPEIKTRTYQTCHKTSIECIDVSLCETYIASIDDKGMVSIQETHTGNSIWAESHDGLYHHFIAFSPCGRFLIHDRSAGLDTHLMIRKTKTGRIVRTITRFNYGPRDISLTENGRFLLAAAPTYSTRSGLSHDCTVLDFGSPNFGTRPDLKDITPTEQLFAC